MPKSSAENKQVSLPRPRGVGNFYQEGEILMKRPGVWDRGAEDEIILKFDGPRVILQFKVLTSWIARRIGSTGRRGKLQAQKVLDI